MHELSIALSLLDAIGEQALRHGAARVVAVRLKVGALSGVVPQALAGAFELARQGTDFEQCRLIIEQTPVIIRCPTCQADRPVESIQQMHCSVCGTATADVVCGRELDLCAIEVSE